MSSRTTHLWRLIKDILHLLGDTKRLTIIFLLISMLLIAIIEMIGVGLIMPYIALFDSARTYENNRYFITLSSALGSPPIKTFIVYCSIGLAGFYIIKNVLTAFLIHWQNAVLATSEAESTSRLLKSYLLMPYIHFLKRNSSELINTLGVEMHLVFTSLIKPALIVLSDSLILILILALLVYASPLATLTSLIGAFVTGLLFYIFLRKPTKRLGAVRQAHKEKTFKWINQSLGSLKELTVLNKCELFYQNFKQHVYHIIHAQTFYETAIQLPRLVVESIGVIMLVVVALLLLSTNQDLLPVLSLFAMAAFRTMPAINRIIVSATKVRYYSQSLGTIIHDLSFHAHSSTPQNPHVTQPITFNSTIEIKDLCFTYPETTKPILSHLNLTINKGDAIGIIGPSGTGKSTFIDTLIGLLLPNQGGIYVDGTDIHTNIAQWRSHISYIPQNIYLTDETVKQNVALGIPEAEIDEARVKECLALAELKDFIETLPHGINSEIGERGARISGGQRQRIGIARALYNNPFILLLDEATAGLDPDTEKKICNTLQTLSNRLTIIAISHQPQLTAIAKRIYKLEYGTLYLQENNTH